MLKRRKEPCSATGRARWVPIFKGAFLQRLVFDEGLETTEDRSALEKMGRI